MIAIHTKFIPASNVRGSRIKAYCADGRSVTISKDHALSQEQAHFAAARAFAEKHLRFVPDTSRMVYGDSADNKGFVFCFPDSIIEVETA